MTKTTKTSQVTQSETLEEPAEIQAAAGGRPTRLTHEQTPSEASASETPKQQKSSAEPSEPEPTKLKEVQPAEEVRE